MSTREERHEDLLDNLYDICGVSRILPRMKCPYCPAQLGTYSAMDHHIAYVHDSE